MSLPASASSVSGRPAASAPADSSGEPARSRWPRRLLSAAIVGLSLWAMIWASSDADGSAPAFLWRGQKADYYNLLVDGFLDGHLSLKVPPDANGQLPHLMDASLYRGKYYLYFGVVPAVLLYLPYAALTGHDLPGNAAVLFEVAGGFLFSVLLFRAARRAHFPTLTAPLEAGCLLLLAFGGGTAILCFDGGFYEVAIAGGYLCFTAALLGLYHVMQNHPAALRWMAWASGWAGLAVGCRPTYLFALPILLMPAWGAWRRRDIPRARRLALAAMLPAAVVGATLAAYNQARFGSPLEFGFRYQVNVLMRRGLPLARPEFVWPNLKWYYLTPPELSPFFPYVLPIEAAARPAQYYGYELIHGQWLVLPLVFGTAALLVLALRKAKLPGPSLLRFSAGAGLAFLATCLTMLSFGFRANRYVVDFQPMLVIAIVLGAAASRTALMHAAPFAARWLGRLFVIGAIALSAFNYAVGMQWMDHLANTRPQTFAALAPPGNWPALILARLGLIDFGPVRFHIRFRPVPVNREDEVLHIGTSGYETFLRAALQPPNHLEFILENGVEVLRSPPLALDFARDYEVELSAGMLYPTPDHPAFAHWTRAAVQQVKTTAVILVNGGEVIRGSFAAKPHVPAAFPVPAHASAYQQVSGLERLPFDRFKPAREFGLWRFAVRFEPHGPATQPLLGSGVTGAGNMLFVQHEGPHQIRFALDSWGHELATSAPLTIDPAVGHELEIVVGPQVARQVLPAAWGLGERLAARQGTLQVWLDRQPVWITAIPDHLDSYDVVASGANPQGFSTTAPLFAGSLRAQPLTDDARRELLQRALR
jgi:hypothetical protein